MRLGIDPGREGAIALLYEDRVCWAENMPMIAKVHGSGFEVDAVKLHELINLALTEARGNRQQLACYLEQVNAGVFAKKKGQSRPKQGAVSAFSFGEGFGVVRGAIAGYEIPLKRVPPVEWKRRAHLVGKPKEASLAVAMERFPMARSMLDYGRGKGLSKPLAIGRAEAILIAAFGE